MTTGPEWLTSEIAGRTWPFMEDENGDITGFGHRDKRWFADQVNLYDLACNGVVIEAIEPDHVTHDWLYIDEQEETFRRCSENDEGAIPVTLCWNVR